MTHTDETLIDKIRSNSQNNKQHLKLLDKIKKNDITNKNMVKDTAFRMMKEIKLMFPKTKK